MAVTRRASAVLGSGATYGTPMGMQAQRRDAAGVCLQEPPGSTGFHRPSCPQHGPQLRPAGSGGAAPVCWTGPVHGKCDEYLMDGGRSVDHRDGYAERPWNDCEISSPVLLFFACLALFSYGLYTLDRSLPIQIVVYICSLLICRKRIQVALTADL